MEDGPIIYEVRLEIRPEIAPEFDAWLHGHVEAMLPLPGFEGARLLEEEQNDPALPDAPVVRTVQYDLESRSALDAYIRDHAPRMRQAGIDRFGDRFVATRRVLSPTQTVARVSPAASACQNCGTAPDGTPLVLQSYTYVEFGDELLKAHRLVAEMLAEAGIKVERKAVEGGKLWNTWEKGGIELHGKFDLDLWDDGYFGVDPTTYLTNLYDPRSIPTRTNPIAGLNVMRYRNPRLADLFDALNRPLPNNRRRALLCELAITVDQDLPQIPLLAFPDLYGISIDLQGVAPHIYDTVTWNAGDWQLVRPQSN